MTLPRVPPPTPEQVRQARLAAGLTQAQAAALLAGGTGGSYRTWQNYEAAVEAPAHRPMVPASWELFLLLTDQHPTLQLKMRERR